MAFGAEIKKTAFMKRWWPLRFDEINRLWADKKNSVHFIAMPGFYVLTFRMRFEKGLWLMRSSAHNPHTQSIPFQWARPIQQHPLASIRLGNSSHLVIHANHFIVTLTNPFLYPIARHGMIMMASGKKLHRYAKIYLFSAWGINNNAYSTAWEREER